jgi:hypothetical protein
MKKVIFLFFICGFLYANDYKWDLVLALSRNDYQAAERIINQNINSLPAAERRLVMNFAVTYSTGETALRVLSLLQRHNVHPSDFDLYTALNRNQPDAIIQFILDRGVRVNGEILLLAMERQRFNFASQFIQAGADVNFQFPLPRHDTDGMTSLLYASIYNNFEMVRLLVEHGANINARNREGNTALSIAQSNGNNQIMDFLLERGAIQTAAGQVPMGAQTGGGIGSFLDSQTVEFQTGVYRLSNGNRDLTFTGTSNFGNVGFIRNNRVYSGSYQSTNGNLTITIEGRMFVYRIDSNTSFSGNGEVWSRIVN